jgi:hypothetical protein
MKRLSSFIDSTATRVPRKGGAVASFVRYIYRLFVECRQDRLERYHQETYEETVAKLKYEIRRSKII